MTLLLFINCFGDIYVYKLNWKENFHHSELSIIDTFDMSKQGKFEIYNHQFGDVQQQEAHKV